MYPFPYTGEGKGKGLIEMEKYEIRYINADGKVAIETLLLDEEELQNYLQELNETGCYRIDFYELND